MVETNLEAVEVVNEAPAEQEKTSENTQSAPRRPQRSDNRGRGRKGTSGRRTPKKKEFEETVVSINRVAKTVKGGRKIRFAAVVVVGDKKGRYGFANAKAIEVPDAIKKSIEAATKNVHTVELVNADTISHEIVGVFGACKVFLKPAPEGTGIIAGGPVRTMLELAGIRNVYSKIYGSRNPLNVLRATDNGLQNLKSYAQVKALREL